MKNVGAIAALALVSVPLILWASAIGLTVYGLYLAFSASIILGVIALVLEPSPFIIGLVAVFGHPDIAQRIANWLGL